MRKLTKWKIRSKHPVWFPALESRMHEMSEMQVVKVNFRNIKNYSFIDLIKAQTTYVDIKTKFVLVEHYRVINDTIFIKEFEEQTFY